jgi:hypothetical protein
LFHVCGRVMKKRFCFCIPNGTLLFHFRSSSKKKENSGTGPTHETNDADKSRPHFSC